MLILDALMSKLQRALKAREDATMSSLTYFYRPFRARLQMPGPYQALRTPCSHLATFFRLRCRLLVSSNATCAIGREDFTQI